MEMYVLDSFFLEISLYSGKRDMKHFFVLNVIVYVRYAPVVDHVPVTEHLPEISKN